VILLDTHAFLWLVDNPELLSNAAYEKINTEIKAKKPIMVSSISIWEICLLTAKNRLDIEGGVEAWIGNASVLPEFEYIPVSNRIAVESVFLPGEFHPDPADRIIVATARINGATVVSKDTRIRNYVHVETLW